MQVKRRADKIVGEESGSETKCGRLAEVNVRTPRSTGFPRIWDTCDSGGGNASDGEGAVECPLEKTAYSLHGLELLFDTLLLMLRTLSLSYWLRVPFERRNDTTRRNNIVDGYCLAELIGLSWLLLCSRHPASDKIVCAYILFEIYLSLFNIVFLGKFPNINNRPPSIERDILLMFLNVLHWSWPLPFFIVPR